jgi:hypothetical protein
MKKEKGESKEQREMNKEGVSITHECLQLKLHHLEPSKVEFRSSATTDSGLKNPP